MESSPPVPRARAVHVNESDNPRLSDNRTKPPPPSRNNKVQDLAQALRVAEAGNIKGMEEVVDSMRPTVLKLAAQIRGVFSEKFAKKAIGYLKSFSNDPEDAYAEQVQQVLFEGRFSRAQGLTLRQQEPCFVQLTPVSLRFVMGKNANSQLIYKQLGARVTTRGPQKLHHVPLLDVKQLRLDIPFQFKPDEGEEADAELPWHSFLLVSGSKSIVLATHNKTQRDEWVQLISSATTRVRLASRGQGDCLKGLYVRVPERMGEGGSSLARYRDVLSQRIGALEVANPSEVLRRLKDFAPIFAEDVICKNCDSPFTVFLRRHHCRKCGESFCHSCSNKRFVLQGKSVRVCSQCFMFLSEHENDANSNDIDNVPSLNGRNRGGERKSNNSSGSNSASSTPPLSAKNSFTEPLADIEQVFPMSIRQSVSHEMRQMQLQKPPRPPRLHRLGVLDEEGNPLLVAPMRRLALSEKTA